MGQRVVSLYCCRALFRGFSGLLLVYFDVSGHPWASICGPLGCRIGPWGLLSGLRVVLGDRWGLLGTPWVACGGQWCSWGCPGEPWGAPGRPWGDPGAPSEAIFAKQAALQDHWFYCMKWYILPPRGALGGPWGGQSTAQTGDNEVSGGRGAHNEPKNTGAEAGKEKKGPQTRP